MLVFGLPRKSLKRNHFKCLDKLGPKTRKWELKFNVAAGIEIEINSSTAGMPIKPLNFNTVLPQLVLFATGSFIDMARKRQSDIFRQTFIYMLPK